MGMHPSLAEHIAKWHAKRVKETEERRRLAAERYKASEERRRSEMPSTRRNWRVRADETATIEIPQWAKEVAAAPTDLKTVDHTPDRLLAPGCFGLAMTYTPDAKECVPCPFEQRCKASAAQMWITLHAERNDDSEFHKELAERRAHDRARNRKDKAKSRAEAKVKVPPKRLPIASIVLTRAALADRKAKLVEWLAQDEPRSRQLREYQKEILLDYVVFQNERRRTGGDPGPTAFARLLTKQTGRTFSISSAQKRLARLCRLESAEGPWFAPVSYLLV